MRTNQILRILHFGRSSKFHFMETMWNVLNFRILHFRRSSKFHFMETMWNVLNFHSNFTVCHSSTSERDDSNEFHSVEFIRLKVSSTLIPHFSTVGLNDFQFHINNTLIQQLVSCLCISNVELETSTIWY